MAGQEFGPQARQRDLANGSTCLGIGQAAPPALGQAQLARTQRNRARRHHDHLLPGSAGGSDFGHQPRQPGAARLPVLAHQQRRADLDDKARAHGRIGEVRQLGNAHDRRGLGQMIGQVKGA